MKRLPLFVPGGSSAKARSSSIIHSSNGRLKTNLHKRNWCPDGILIFFIGKWEDNIKHQEILVIVGYAVSCLGFLGYLFVDSPIKLFAIEGIFGVATAVRSPAFASLYSKNLDVGKYASEWGTWESIGWVVIGLAALIGGYLAKLYGFK